MGSVSTQGRELGIQSPGYYTRSATDQKILRGISPLERFPTGVLFPIHKGEEGIDPASEIDDEEECEVIELEGVASPTALAKPRRFMPPSSVGFSFFVRGKTVELQVSCAAVRYQRVGERDDRGRYRGQEWERLDLDPITKTFNAPVDRANPFSEPRIKIWDDCGRAAIDLLWRPFEDGWIATVSLFNAHEMLNEGEPGELVMERTQNALFEVALGCAIAAGEVGTYPRVDRNLLSDEEQEIELQYRHRHIYAVGHGGAVDWAQKNHRLAEIWIDFLPSVEVPQVTSGMSNNNDQTLQLVDLAIPNSPDHPIFAKLDQFILGYSAWVNEQQTLVSHETAEKNAASRIVQRMHIAIARMQYGLQVLRSDARAAQAFAIANQSMLDQMVQNDRIEGKARALTEYRWRPFQLAFLLTVLESSINGDSDFRDTVDLIWFPTGGGKTEAYLGLIALLIVWRRLTYPSSGGGTTVLMRYTLRLLTAQQYQRATRIICALELIRQSTPALGKEPITVGMWVGMATSPNSFYAAQKVVAKAANGSGAVPLGLVLDRCPWCCQSFTVPDSYITSATTFDFRCTNQNCDFGATASGIIPCNVVDEAMYATPPTLLIATIDKFARLAWEKRTNVFFGINGNLPPELVIQDELHLIANALGSIAGLYEAALDTILRQRGVHPKYIASTATIQMAAQQVRRLYGREVAVFPPPGLSCDDSYFAKTVPLTEKPGRLYVGYLAPMLGRQPIRKTPSNLVPLAAALLIAPDILFADQLERADLLDAWWTQVIYHSSLKGVGNSQNAFNVGVRERLRRYTDERHDPSKPALLRPTARLAQLTSIASADQNAATFARLLHTQASAQCLDAVLATNMISVGLDVTRLALMIINGQPLTTAEYIQASSRVGRGEVPGVVFVNYYRDQTRSLSHYENFRPYHESFYRFVEPTSVTPYTYQARSRALHAALVIAVRHSCMHLLDDDRAGHFDPDADCVAKVIELLKHRCSQADSERAQETSQHISKLVDQWRAEVLYCQAIKRQLDYHAPDTCQNTNRLLFNYSDRIKGLWPTLQSMRNVENTALLKPL